jgi:hypothetical protein
MILSLLPKLATLGFFFLASTVFPASSYDANDAVLTNAQASSAQRAVLIPCDDDEAVKKVQQAASQQDQELKASSNPPVKPQPSPKGSEPSSVSAATQPAKPTAPPSTPSPATPKPVPASVPIPQASASVSAPRPMNIAIPEIATGYEDIYRRFIEGKLIYRPNLGSDKGKIEFRIGDLANPLDGTFDLSQCGDTGQYLSISTGYRKGLNPRNENKAEIWLTPRFLVDRTIRNSSWFPLFQDERHLRPIMNSWGGEKATVGIFWSWGSWGKDDYDYLITDPLEVLGSESLYEKWRKLGRTCEREGDEHGKNPLPRPPARALTWPRNPDASAKFHVSFLN